MPRIPYYQGQGFRNPNTVWNNNGESASNGSVSVSHYSKTYQNDERSERQQSGKDNRRRVSFKPTTGGARVGLSSRHTELAIRGRLAEDEDMAVGVYEPTGDNVGRLHNGEQNRGGAKGNRMHRRGSPIPKSGHGPPGKKRLIAGTAGWFMVTIPFGHKHDKQELLKQLHSLVHPNAFEPHYFRVEASSVSFYVDDLTVAEKLLNADRQLTMPDGHRMLIRVRNSVPQVTIDATLREKMKLAMVKRYTPATKALDLTKFHADAELHDIFCALFRPTLMILAIDIIAENIPDLEALKLDDNKIMLIDHLKCLPTKLPFLKILHLANNKISNVHVLEALRECQLVDLVLTGNPAKEKSRDEATYVSEIRRKFPKLVRLDNVDLPPQIGFDIPDDDVLPEPKASFLCNIAGADIVRQFLEQYFIIFDSESRQPLLNAYHEHAMLSMTVAYTSQQHLRLPSYLPYNRNILRCRDVEQRNKLIKNGRLPVVSFLSELPDTQHDPLSFAVDLTLFTPQLIMLNVTGVFNEKPKSGGSHLRSFQKCMTIVPSGAGFCIKNELLHISYCTIHQMKAAFKPSPAVVVPSTAAPNSTAAAQPDEATRLRMIQMIAERSSMNLEWSRKCLEETNWDFDRAAFTFTELHKQNKIPAEAFVK